jgi:chromosomal replication initiator protein
MEDSEVALALSAQLAERIGRKRFDQWFHQRAELRSDGALLTIRTPNAFVRDWMRAYFAEDIRECWAALAGENARFEFEIAIEEAAVNGALQNSEGAAVVPEVPRVAKREVSRSDAVAVVDNAKSGQSGGFATFVVGGSNEYALRSAELTARGRQQASPLLFCGPTGVGKTHLLKAIVQEHRRHHCGAIALYMTAEQFTTSFVEALRGSGIPSFRQKCRRVDLLVIDDLQFFPGKRRTVEELQYTVDTLLADGRQIVFASDRLPAQLHALGQELISRICGGLTCEMTSPEFATRLGIARRFAAECGILLEDDVAQLIATQITTGAREIRGAIHRLSAMSATYGVPVTRELAERGLAEILRHCSRAVRLDDVQKVVCTAFGVEPAQLRSDHKRRSLAEPRMLAMWLARKYTRAPWSEIGEYFGRSSHSTVISAHKRVEKLIAQQAQIGMANQTCDVDDAIRQLETALRTA